MIGFHVHEMSRTGTSTETKRRGGCREPGGVGGGGTLTANGDGVHFEGDENVLGLDSGDVSITLNILQNHPAAHIERNELHVNYISKALCSLMTSGKSPPLPSLSFLVETS